MDDTLYKQLFELTSRIDERLKALVDSNNNSRDRIEKLFEIQTTLLTRITVLENRNDGRTIEDVKKDMTFLETQVNELNERVIHVEKEVGQQSGKWSNLIDFAFKVGQIIVAAIILWKLGVK